jgi:putative PIN family toxin of toxin-antitoxin system
MKIYAVYDTNILVSAMISKRTDTSVVKALEVLLSNEVTPLYNDKIIAEYKEVLHREQFKLPEEMVSKIIGQIEKDGIASERVQSNVYFPDPDDVVFYEVALSREDSFLVTGNTKHFPKTPIVVTPAEFLKIIGKN